MRSSVGSPWPTCPRPAPRPAGRPACASAAARPRPGARRRGTGDLVHRAHRGRQSDALRGTFEQRVQPLQRHRQMCAALGGADRVHLVDDDRVDAAQRLARRGGEQQEQRLRGGDQDVGRAPGELSALIGRGVARAHRHGDVRRRQLEPGRGLADAGQRGAQVALDVDGQRLERADVEDPAAALRIVGRRRAGQPVEGGQERGESLAGPGWGDHQRVLAACDRIPGAGLGLGRPVEGTVQPRLGGGGEARHAVSLPAGSDRTLSSSRQVLLARPLTRGHRVRRRLTKRPLQGPQSLVQRFTLRPEKLLRSPEHPRQCRDQPAGLVQVDVRLAPGASPSCSAAALISNTAARLIMSAAGTLASSRTGSSSDSKPCAGSGIASRG